MLLALTKFGLFSIGSFGFGLCSEEWHDMKEMPMTAHVPNDLTSNYSWHITIAISKSGQCCNFED